jgi:hypothetical protein
MNNLDNLTPDVVARVDALADGTAKRQSKDGGALRAARKEQAADRKPAAPAKSPAAKTADPDKLSRDANREMKRLMVAVMRAVDFDAISAGDDDYPGLKGTKPALMSAEIERHCRYLTPKTDAK